MASIWLLFSVETMMGKKKLADNRGRRQTKTPDGRSEAQTPSA
jgi:hypothetical protein